MPTRVSQAIGGFVGYLHGENIRLREEDRKQKVNDAAEHISREFQGLGPDATLQEIVGLNYSLVNDAAEYGALNESLPLIQGFMQTAMALRDAEIQREQSDILTTGLRDQGFPIPEGATGETSKNLASVFASSLKPVEVENTAGQTISRTVHAITGETISEITTKSKTTQQRIDEELQLQREAGQIKHGFDVDLLGRRTNANILTALINKGYISSDIADKFGLGGQFSDANPGSNFMLGKGYKRIKGSVGDDGRPVFEDKSGIRWQPFLDPQGNFTAQVYRGRLQSAKSGPEMLKITEGAIDAVRERIKDPASYLLSVIDEKREESFIQELFPGVSNYYDTYGKLAVDPIEPFEHLSPTDIKALKKWAGENFTTEGGSNPILSAITDLEEGITGLEIATGTFTPRISNEYIEGLNDAGLNLSTNAVGEQFIQLALGPNVPIDDPYRILIENYVKKLQPSADYDDGVLYSHYQQLLAKNQNKLKGILAQAFQDSQNLQRIKDIVGPPSLGTPTGIKSGIEF